MFRYPSRKLYKQNKKVHTPSKVSVRCVAVSDISFFSHCFSLTHSISLSASFPLNLRCSSTIHTCSLSAKHFTVCTTGKLFSFIIKTLGTSLFNSNTYIGTMIKHEHCTSRRKSYSAIFEYNERGVNWCLNHETVSSGSVHLFLIERLSVYHHSSL